MTSAGAMQASAPACSQPSKLGERSHIRDGDTGAVTHAAGALSIGAVDRPRRRERVLVAENIRRAYIAQPMANLSVSAVTKSYGAKKLFEDVSVNFTAGKRYGLTG